MKEYKENFKLESANGWFWFCPIKWSQEKKELSPRFDLGFLLEIALFMHHSMLFVSGFFGIEIDNVYPIKITKTKFK